MKGKQSIYFKTGSTILQICVLLATMTLVALTMGFLGHTVPQVNVLIVGFPIRAMISLLVIAVTLSGVGRVVVDLVPSVIDDIRKILTAV